MKLISPFACLLLPLLAPSMAAAQTGADWSTPTSGVIAGTSFNVTGLNANASVVTWNLSTANYAAAPLSSSQECTDTLCRDDWEATFAQPIEGLTWYGVFIRGFDAGPAGTTVAYTFNHPFVILSGFQNATVSGTSLVVTTDQFHHGVIRFSGPVSTLRCDTSATTGGFQSMTLGQFDEGGTQNTFCDPSTANSTGLPTRLVANLGTGIGSGLHLDALQGPPGQFGYFLVGTAPSEPGLPLGQGRFCLAVTGGNGFARYNVFGDARNSVGQFDAAGVLQNLPGTSTTGIGFDVPTFVSPVLGSITTGSTWHFQLWHREAGGSSNFSNGLSVSF